MTQGKLFDDDEKLWAVEHAIDNDLSTVAATETGDGLGWIKLQFDEKHLIHKMILYLRFYTNWYEASTGCILNVEDFKRCADLDNNVDVSVYHCTRERCNRSFVEQFNKHMD